MTFPGLRVEYHRQLIGGVRYYHARLLTHRDGYWLICGVLQVDGDDWLRFLTLFNIHRIEVTETHGDTLPAERPDHTAQ